jgi:glycosyltransferase involved in cell wall biosynthesis
MEQPAPISESLLDGRPLRVLMFTDYFPKPTIPAMGVWALTQAKALAAAGAEIQVMSPTSWIPPLLGRFGSARRFAKCPNAHNWDGVNVEYPRWFFYSVGPVRNLWYGRPALASKLASWTIRRRLFQKIESFRPDVIFAHNSVPCGLVALQASKKYGIPYIVEDLDFGSIESCARYPSRLKAFEKVSRGAWAMAGASKRIAEALAKLVSGIRTVPLYMGTQRLPAEMWNMPRPAEIEGKTVVFSAAIFYERKGIPLLIDAFASIAAKHPNAVLRVGGEGHERPAIEAAAARANLGDRIKLLGSLQHERVLQEMVWADIFMLVGWEEPFATVYLEAMAAKKPIICCSDGGICDVMTDGVEGRAVEPKSVAAAAAALDQLLSDESLRGRMSAAAWDLFEKRLTSEATARATLQILQNAAKQSKPANAI